MPDSTTYDGVQYTDNTVVIDRAALATGLVSRKLSTFHFRHGTAGLNKLRAGKIVIFAGLDLRRVTAVRQTGTETVVETSPANVADAIRTGTLGLRRTVNWAKLPRAAYHQATARAGLTARNVEIGFQARTNPGVPSPAASLPIDLGGNVNGFEVSFKLSPQPNGKLHFDLSALQRTVLKVTATGSIDPFVYDTRLAYDGRTGRHFTAHVTGLAGEAQLTWASVGVGSAVDSESRSLSLPFEVPIPIEVGPIPLILTVKSILRFAPSLTPQSSSGGSFKITYDGDQGFSVNSSKVTPYANVRKTTAALGDKDTVTAGYLPVGFGWGWEFPRLEMSLPGTGTFVFLTFDSYMAGEFTPGTTFSNHIPPCQMAFLQLRAVAGYKLGALGMTVLGAETELWQNKTFFYKDDKPCTMTGK